MELQWILVFISVLIVAVIAWHTSKVSPMTFYRKHRAKRQKRQRSLRPHFSDDALQQSNHQEHYEQNARPAERPYEDEPAAPPIISLYLKSRPGKLLEGDKLLMALNRAGMRFGQYDIFHYNHLFSCALAREPGIFDINRMDLLKTDAVIFFMESSQHAHDQREAFETMLEIAQLVADALQAELYDSQWRKLGDETLSYIYDQIVV